MRAIVSQRLKLRAKRQRRKRKRLEEHAPHRAVMASTLGVAASAILACIPGNFESFASSGCGDGTYII